MTRAAFAASPLTTWMSVAGMCGHATWWGLLLFAGVLAGGAVLLFSAFVDLMVAMSMPLFAALILAFASRLLPARADRWATAWILAALAAAAGAYFANRWYVAVASPAHLIRVGASITERTLLVWLACVALPLLFQQAQAHRNELQTHRLNAVTAELKALQAQIEPHFLYNTLANTRYLARHDPPRAVAMLDHLIAYLHQALPDMRRRSSDVARECELARHYLALMAIRFGERMSFDVQVALDAAHAEMAPLLLMSLVENAVRHGVEPMPGIVRVEVTAELAGDSLRLVVTDSGPGPGAAVMGSGVGLRNLRERLHALYGAQGTFTLRREADDLTRAELTLPFVLH